GLLDKIANVANVASGGLAMVSQNATALTESFNRTEQLLKNIAALDENIRKAQSGELSVVQAQVDSWQRQRDSLQREAQAQAELRKTLFERNTPTMPAVTVPGLRPPGGGGGGGSSEQDSIERQILRYQELAKAAQKAYDTIDASRGKAIDDLQREVRVQQQVDEVVAKLGAKHPYSAEQLRELHDAVSAYEQL